MKKPTIFISIASFCDPMLLFTIQSALNTAQFPDRLAFGIVDQNTSSIADDIPTGDWRVAYLLTDPAESRGACWARSLAMSLYAEETYFLQVDSHTHFEEGWDEIMIETLETVSAKTNNSKIVVSTRPFAFELDSEGVITTRRFTSKTLRLVPKKDTFNAADPVLHFSAVASDSDQDVPGFQISAAFVFSRGAIVNEIPYDPYLYFHGEEQNFSVRAFTHGWDIWHPNAVPLNHLYKYRDGGEPTLHWDKEFDEKRDESWTQLKARANSRLSKLFMGRNLGAYSLGNRRSFQDYLKVSKLNWSAPTRLSDFTVGGTFSVRM